MIPITLRRIADVVDGEVHDADPELVVTSEAFVDSRASVAGGLFVAVAGERVDGHDYARGAMAAGAAAVLGSRPVGLPAVVVADPVAALGILARHVLSRLPELAVIGITGSQGKTGTKDVLAQLLERLGETVAASESFNNEIGVPLTALRAGPATRFLVVEMGARGRGHIHYLASIVRPSVGMVLNVGLAHVSEFGSQEAIAVAKGELIEVLPVTGLAVLNADDALVAAMRTRTQARVMTFGEAAAADVRIGDIGLDDGGHVRLALSAGGERRVVTVRLVGEHQARNVAAAAATAIGCGMPFEQVTDALGSVEARSHWRMEIERGLSGATVINDAYNANPDSMRAALRLLVELGDRRGDTRTIAVLGEMRELGEASWDAHVETGRLAVQMGVSQLVVVGEEARAMHEGALLEAAVGRESVCVPDIDAAISFLDCILGAGDLVLVKASRAVGLERVALALTAAATRDEGGPRGAVTGSGGGA